MKIKNLFVTFGAASLLALVACAAPADDASEAPQLADDDALEERVSTQGWDQTVSNPTISYALCSVRATATFKHTSGSVSTRAGGECILESIAPWDTACNVDADCAVGTPGDYGYCLKPANLGQKLCFHKALGDGGGDFYACQSGQVMTLALGQTATYSPGFAVNYGGYRYVTLSVLNNPGARDCGNAAYIPGTNRTYAEDPAYCTRAVSSQVQSLSKFSC